MELLPKKSKSNWIKSNHEVLNNTQPYIKLSLDTSSSKNLDINSDVKTSTHESKKIWHRSWLSGTPTHTLHSLSVLVLSLIKFSQFPYSDTRLTDPLSHIKTSLSLSLSLCLSRLLSFWPVSQITFWSADHSSFCLDRQLTAGVCVCV